MQPTLFSEISEEGLTKTLQKRERGAALINKRLNTRVYSIIHAAYSMHSFLSSTCHLASVFEMYCKDWIEFSPEFVISCFHTQKKLHNFLQLKGIMFRRCAKGRELYGLHKHRLRGQPTTTKMITYAHSTIYYMLTRENNQSYDTLEDSAHMVSTDGCLCAPFLIATQPHHTSYTLSDHTYPP